MINSPEIWRDKLPKYNIDINKYDKGHAVVFGGDETCTGASRLAAKAALRIGAGLVTLACPPSALDIYAKSLESVMVKPVADGECGKFIDDEQKNAVLIGPGAGVNSRTKDIVINALKQKKSSVIDADAITVFEGKSEELFAMINSPTILTPHEGEFKRIFDMGNNREESVAKAAKISGAVVILKGNQTIIASPDGRVVTNNNAPNYLATAGSGDVLAGLCVGLLAMKMSVFDAGCAAVWIHGQLGNKAGIGLIAEDLEQYIPDVLEELNCE